MRALLKHEGSRARSAEPSAGVRVPNDAFAPGAARAVRDEGGAAAGDTATAAAAIDIRCSIDVQAQIKEARGKGQEAVRARDWVTAVECYSEAVAFDEHDSASMLHLAICHNKLGNFYSGMMHAEQVTRLKADRWNGWATKGDALLALGRFTEAKASYERALAIEQRSAREELIKNYSRAAAMAAASDRMGKAEPRQAEIGLEEAQTEPDVIAIAETDEVSAAMLVVEPTKEVQIIIADLQSRAADNPQLSEELAPPCPDNLNQDRLESDTKIVTSRQYMLLTKTNFRSGIGIDSNKIETLQQGEVIQAVEIHGDATGRARVRCPAGWTSVVSPLNGDLLLEENFVPGVDAHGFPLRIIGERALAQVDATARTSSGKSTVLGMSVLTSSRLLWWASPLAGASQGGKSKRRMSFSSKNYDIPEPDRDASSKEPISLPLRRVGRIWASNDKRSGSVLKVQLSHGPASRWPAAEELTFCFNVGKTARRDSFRHLLQAAVDAEVRLDRNFKPLFLAERWLAEICQDVLKENSVAKVVDEWNRYSKSPDRQQEIIFSTEAAEAVLEKGKLLLDQLTATIIGRKGQPMRAIVDSVPGWRDDHRHILKMGFVECPAEEDATQNVRRFLLLKNDSIEVYEENLTAPGAPTEGIEVPFRRLQRQGVDLEQVSTAQKWMGRRLVANNGKLAPAFTFKVRATKDADSFCCICGSEAEMESWIDAIIEAAAAAKEKIVKEQDCENGPPMGADDEFLQNLAEQEHTDNHVSSTVRRVTEREVLAPCMDLLWQSCEQTTTLDPDALSQAIYRLSQEPQESEAFGLGKRNCSPSKWAAAVQELNEMDRGPTMHACSSVTRLATQVQSNGMLPCELYAILARSQQAIYKTFEREVPGKVLGGDDFLDVFVFVVSKSNVPKLAILTELMSRFPGTSEEEYLCTTTVAALSHLVSMVGSLPKIEEGGGQRPRRGGMAALPSTAVPLGEPEPELAEVLEVGALDFDKTDDSDAESSRKNPLPSPQGSPHATVEGKATVDFSES